MDDDFWAFDDSEDGLAARLGTAPKRRNKMKIGVATCTHCGTILTSRANHDFNSCECGTISVDGGHWYKEEQMHTFYKMCFTSKEDYTFSTIELDITRQELYDDWNKRRDEYKHLNKHLGE